MLHIPDTKVPVPGALAFQAEKENFSFFLLPFLQGGR